MKALLLLRHAKPSHRYPELADHDRPLNQRGLQTAPRMGALVLAQDLVMDIVLCSTAVRAHATASLVAEACGYAGEIWATRQLYQAGPEVYFDVLRGVVDQYTRVLVGLDLIQHQMDEFVHGHADAVFIQNGVGCQVYGRDHLDLALPRHSEIAAHLRVHYVLVETGLTRECLHGHAARAGDLERGAQAWRVGLEGSGDVVEHPCVDRAGAGDHLNDTIGRRGDGAGRSGSSRRAACQDQCCDDHEKSLNHMVWHRGGSTPTATRRHNENVQVQFRSLNHPK